MGWGAGGGGGVAVGAREMRLRPLPVPGCRMALPWLATAGGPAVASPGMPRSALSRRPSGVPGDAGVGGKAARGVIAISSRPGRRRRAAG